MTYIMDPTLAEYLAFFRSDVSKYNENKAISCMGTLVVFALRIS